MINALTGDTFDVDFRKLLRGYDVLMMCAVISRTLTAPPGSPANGACYIVGASPTGAWAGQTNSIAVWTTDNPATPGGLWEFYPPKAGFLAYSVADAALYEYSGTAWVAAGGGGGGSVFGASGPAHSTGIVPDPGATAGVTRFLREDATFAVPAGGGGGASAPYFISGRADQVLNVGGTFFSAQNGMYFFHLPFAVTTTHLWLDITSGDGTQVYDFGICDDAGNLLLNLGPTSFPGTGSVSTAWLQGSTTLPAGFYYFCISVANGASTLQIAAGQQFWPAAHPVSATASTGTLPATLAPPTATGFNTAGYASPAFALE
jgi:hypothetical protein